MAKLLQAFGADCYSDEKLVQIVHNPLSADYDNAS